MIIWRDIGTKRRQNKTSRTRNSKYLNSVNDIHTNSYSNLPAKNHISLKRWNTSFNGANPQTLLVKENRRPSYRNDAAPIWNKIPKSNENNYISWSSKFNNDSKLGQTDKNSSFLDLGSDSDKGHTPLKSKISSLKDNTQEKNLLNNGYNTIECLDSTYKRGIDSENLGLGGQTYENEVEWNEEANDTFDDECADIEDSMILDEVAISQREINSSFINIKRNGPLEYKLQRFKK